MELLSNYMKDDTYRHMLNDLTQKVFGFDFENWVTKGYFEGDYIPYSLMEDGKFVSNVSANRMKFMQNGSEKNYIQIGTVMTDPDYRKQGLASKLMNHVIEEYEAKCDGIYLFGNLDALGFYRKLGFGEVNEYRYFVKDEFLHSGNTKNAFKSIEDMGDDIKKKYLDLVRSGVQHSAFEQINKYGLQLFYTGDFDNVFYSEDLDCFVVLEQDDTVILQSVLSGKKIALRDVLERIDFDGKKCMLGFVPLDEDKDLCVSEKYDGADDYRLFYKGKELESIEQDKLYFPDLSHA